MIFVFLPRIETRDQVLTFLLALGGADLCAGGDCWGSELRINRLSASEVVLLCITDKVAVQSLAAQILPVAL